MKKIVAVFAVLASMLFGASATFAADGTGFYRSASKASYVTATIWDNIQSADCIYKYANMTVVENKISDKTSSDTQWMVNVSLYTSNWCTGSVIEDLRGSRELTPGELVISGSGFLKEVKVNNVTVPVLDAAGNSVTSVSFDGTITGSIDAWRDSESCKGYSADARSGYNSKRTSNTKQSAAKISGQFRVGTSLASDAELSGSVYHRSQQQRWSYPVSSFGGQG